MNDHTHDAPVPPDHGADDVFDLDDEADDRPIQDRLMSPYLMLVCLLNLCGGGKPSDRIAALQSVSLRAVDELNDLLEDVYEVVALAHERLNDVRAGARRVDPDAPFYTAVRPPSAPPYAPRPTGRPVPEPSGVPALTALVAAVPSDGSGEGGGFNEFLWMSLQAVLVLAGFPTPQRSSGSDFADAVVTMEALSRAVPELQGRYLAEFALELVTGVEAALRVAECDRMMGTVPGYIPPDMVGPLNLFRNTDSDEGAKLELSLCGPRLPAAPLLG